MKFLFLLIAPIFSLKLCINCKHFIPDNKENIFGKCKMFPQIENKLNYLINGIKKDGYSYCSTARGFSNMCGEDGKMFKKKRVSKMKKITETNETMESIDIY